MTKEIDYDKENNIVTIRWWKKGEEYIGWTEKLNFGGVTILLDRNKSGKVRAMEII